MRLYIMSQNTTHADRDISEDLKNANTVLHFEEHGGKGAFCFDLPDGDVVVYASGNVTFLLKRRTNDV